VEKPDPCCLGCLGRSMFGATLVALQYTSIDGDMSKRKTRYLTQASTISGVKCDDSRAIFSVRVYDDPFDPSSHYQGTYWLCDTMRCDGMGWVARLDVDGNVALTVAFPRPPQCTSRRRASKLPWNGLEYSAAWSWP